MVEAVENRNEDAVVDNFNDHHGYYTERFIWECDQCGHRNHIGDDECGNCHNTQRPTNRYKDYRFWKRTFA